MRCAPATSAHCRVHSPRDQEREEKEGRSAWRPPERDGWIRAMGPYEPSTCRAAYWSNNEWLLIRARRVLPAQVLTGPERRMLDLAAHDGRHDPRATQVFRQISVPDGEVGEIAFGDATAFAVAERGVRWSGSVGRDRHFRRDL